MLSSEVGHVHCFQADWNQAVVTNKPLLLRIHTESMGVASEWSAKIKISDNLVRRRANVCTSRDAVWMHPGRLGSFSVDKVAPDGINEVLALMPNCDGDGRAFLYDVSTKGGITAGRQKQHYLLLQRSGVYAVKCESPSALVNVVLEDVTGKTYPLRFWASNPAMSAAVQPLWIGNVDIAAGHADDDKVNEFMDGVLDFNGYDLPAPQQRPGKRAKADNSYVDEPMDLLDFHLDPEEADAIFQNAAGMLQPMSDFLEYSSDELQPAGSSGTKRKHSEDFQIYDASPLHWNVQRDPAPTVRLTCSHRWASDVRVCFGNSVISPAELYVESDSCLSFVAPACPILPPNVGGYFSVPLEVSVNGATVLYATFTYEMEQDVLMQVTDVNGGMDEDSDDASGGHGSHYGDRWIHSPSSGNSSPAPDANSGGLNNGSGFCGGASYSMQTGAVVADGAAPGLESSGMQRQSSSLSNGSFSGSFTSDGFFEPRLHNCAPRTQCLECSTWLRPAALGVSRPAEPAAAAAGAAGGAGQSKSQTQTITKTIGNTLHTRTVVTSVRRCTCCRTVHVTQTIHNATRHGAATAVRQFDFSSSAVGNSAPTRRQEDNVLENEVLQNDDVLQNVVLQCEALHPVHGGSGGAGLSTGISLSRSEPIAFDSCAHGAQQAEILKHDHSDHHHHHHHNHSSAALHLQGSGCRVNQSRQQQQQQQQVQLQQARQQQQQPHLHHDDCLAHDPKLQNEDAQLQHERPLQFDAVLQHDKQLQFDAQLQNEQQLQHDQHDHKIEFKDQPPRPHPQPQPPKSAEFENSILQCEESVSGPARAAVATDNAENRRRDRCGTVALSSLHELDKKKTGKKKPETSLVPEETTRSAVSEGSYRYYTRRYDDTKSSSAVQRGRQQGPTDTVGTSGIQRSAHVASQNTNNLNSDTNFGSTSLQNAKSSVQHAGRNIVAPGSLPAASMAMNAVQKFGFMFMMTMQLVQLAVRGSRSDASTGNRPLVAHVLALIAGLKTRLQAIPRSEVRPASFVLLTALASVCQKIAPQALVDPERRRRLAFALLQSMQHLARLGFVGSPSSNESWRWRADEGRWRDRSTTTSQNFDATSVDSESCPRDRKSSSAQAATTGCSTTDDAVNPQNVSQHIINLVNAFVLGNRAHGMVRVITTSSASTADAVTVAQNSAAADAFASQCLQADNVQCRRLPSNSVTVTGLLQEILLASATVAASGRGTVVVYIAADRSTNGIVLCDGIVTFAAVQRIMRMFCGVRVCVLLDKQESLPAQSSAVPDV